VDEDIRYAGAEFEKQQAMERYKIMKAHLVGVKYQLEALGLSDEDLATLRQVHVFLRARCGQETVVTLNKGSRNLTKKQNHLRRNWMKSKLRIQKLFGHVCWVLEINDFTVCSA